MRERVPHEELLTLRRTAPVSFVEQPPESRAGFPDHQRLLGGQQARRRCGHLQGPGQLLDQPRRRHHPVRPADGPRGRREHPVPADQPRRTRPHQAPPDRLPGVHPEGHRGAARRPEASVPRDRRGGRREGRGQLRRGRRGRAAAPGDRRSARRTAGRPRQALRVVEPDDVLRRPRGGGRRGRRVHGDPRLLDGAGRRAPQEPAGRHHHPAGHRRRLRADAEEGRGLTDDEFGFFMVLLAVAGNETTRNAISHGMHAFFQNPDQWELYKETPAGDRRRRDHPLGARRSRCSSAPRSTTSRWAASRWPRESGSACSTRAPTTTRTSSPTRSGSTSPATPTRTRPSADTGRTTASAPTWPGSR